jgi:hypothetical protein
MFSGINHAEGQTRLSSCAFILYRHVMNVQTSTLRGEVTGRLTRHLLNANKNSFREHKGPSPPLGTVLIYLNQVHIFTPYFFMVHFNIILFEEYLLLGYDAV